jgi:uncharacterized coiled-coil protein SlyX
MEVGMPDNGRLKNIAKIAGAIVVLSGGGGLGVYEWKESKTKARIRELELHVAGQNKLSVKEGERLMKLEEKVDILADSIIAMNTKLNRMEVKIDFLLESNGG